MSNVQIRSLHGDDLERVSGIECRLAGHSRKGFIEKRFEATETSPDGFISCAALQDGKLAGYACARIEEGEFGTRDIVAVLDVIGTDPDLQRRGIGKTLLAEIERQMKTRGIGTLRTQIDWRNHWMIRFLSSSGFLLAPIEVLERDTSRLEEEVVEVDAVKLDRKWRGRHSVGGGYYENAEWDRVFVRLLKEEDLAAVVRIDRKHTGYDRSAYYKAKFREMLIETGIRVSFVVEEDGFVVGFVMARVDFGEFGKVDKTAVLDTIGIHPAFGGSGIGHALLSELFMNLSTLRIENVFTQLTLSLKHFDMQRFLYSCGFHPSQRLALSKTIS